MILKTKEQIFKETNGRINLENEFLNVNEYLKILKDNETFNLSFDKESLLNEIIEDLIIFSPETKYYAFFKIKEYQGIQYFDIYDYAHSEDSSPKNGENFALISLKNIYDLLSYQNQII